MNPAARFALRLLRLGADTTSAVASNLGASAIDRGDGVTASVCIGVAAAFTAVKGSAEHYLNAEDKKNAEDAIRALVEQHGDLRKALQAIAGGQGPSEILSELRAEELLGLIDINPDDPTELASQQNQILFQIVRWLEDWQAHHVQEAALLSQRIERHFADQAVALTRVEAKADAAHQENAASHLLTQNKLDALSGYLIGQSHRRGQNSLDTMMRASVARCAERWQALGVSRELAVQLSNDVSIGLPTADLLPSAAAPLRILIAELGAGKSLRVERWHQQAILRALEDGDAPIPAYIEASGALGGLEAEVDHLTSALGDWRSLGLALAIDRLERAGPSGAEELLKESRRLVLAHPGSVALLASRPLFRLNVSEVVSPSEMTEVDAFALMSRFAATPVSPYSTHGWPQSLRSAIRRPLFAILAGIDISERRRRPLSVAGLIAHLSERAARNHPITDPTLLRRLAAKCVDAGYANVRASDIGSPDAITPIVDSGLVVRTGNGLRFSLDLLTDWFAAQCLSDGEITVEELCGNPERLERWRYSLSIAVGIFPHETVSKLLWPLASKHPALASQIIDEGMERYAGPDDPGLPAAPAEIECGEKIHEAMQAWVRGLGPLAPAVAPVNAAGQLLPVGVLSDGPGLTVSWNRLRNDLPPVSHLARGQSFEERVKEGWMKIHWARPATASAWAWSWSLSELSQVLKSLVEQRRLPALPGPLLDEEVWHQALILSRKGSLSPGPVPLEELLPLSQPYGAGYRFRHWDGRIYDFAELRAVLEQLSRSGKTQLESPWPTPDRAIGRYVWSGYSPQRLLERTEAVFSGALRAYGDLVTSCFPLFRDRMPLATLMPVNLLGQFVSLDPGASDRAPLFRWHFEPLPSADQSRVTLTLGASASSFEELGLDRDAFLELLRGRRPDSWRWLSVAIHSECLDVFGDQPVTKLAYEWLQADLREVHWWP